VTSSLTTTGKAEQVAPNVLSISQDPRLEAHPSQVPVSNVHNALLPTGSTARIAPVRSTHLGAGLAMMATALLVGRAARRRARARAL